MSAGLSGCKTAWSGNDNSDKMPTRVDSNRSGRQETLLLKGAGIAVCERGARNAVCGLPTQSKASSLDQASSSRRRGVSLQFLFFHASHSVACHSLVAR